MSKHRVAVLKVVSSAAVRHRRRGRSTGSAGSTCTASCAGTGMAGSTPSSRGPGGHARSPQPDVRTPCATGSSPCGPSSPPAASTRARSRSPGTSEREGLPVPSTSTIRRILHAAGLVAPEPRKRPRSSWIRFEAAAPNEVWQSDFTHWRLADGSEVEIISWLDDHSRYLLACTAFRRVSGDDVVATFTAAGDAHGWPAATLTDNGAVYTSRFTGGRNGFEYLLAYLGVRQKNGSPGHPQTQGKIERFHQTLKRWLGQRPAAPGLSPSSRPSSTPSASPTTSSGRTGRSAGRHPARRTGRRPRRSPPAPAAGATSGSATTSPTGRAP